MATDMPSDMANTSSELARLEEHGWSWREHLVRRDGVWCTGDSRVRPVSYPENARRALAATEDASYWFRHRNRAVTDLMQRIGVRKAIWDVGAGNGAVAVHLQEQGFDVVAVEPSATGARTAFDRGIDTVVAGALEDLGLPDSSIGAVGLFDVLEHLAAPSALLSEVARVLSPGGTLLVTVPAFSRLWSHADVEAGHFRRYTRQSLDAEVLGHGFRSRHSQYLFHSLVPAVFVGRVLRSTAHGEGGGTDGSHDVDALVAQLRPRRRSLRSLAAAALAVERALDRLRPLPFGTSVMAAYTRTG